jgi:hypothetical protein
MFEFQSVRRSFPRNFAENSEMELLTFSLILYQSKNCGHRIHVLFMYLQWKTQMRSEYFSHNVLAGNINRWKNITADGLFRKNGTTTIWIWKHWNNLMVDNCSKRNSNWEIDDWMVRTEVKISMKKKYSACLYLNFLLAWAGQIAGIENQTMHRFEQYLKILQLYHGMNMENLR